MITDCETVFFNNCYNYIIHIKYNFLGGIKSQLLGTEVPSLSQ